MKVFSHQQINKVQSYLALFELIQPDKFELKHSKIYLSKKETEKSGNVATRHVFFCLAFVMNGQYESP
jgi:hypothetical protein